MTSVQVVEDWASPMWRLNNLYTIVDAQGQRIPFRMNEEQRDLYERMWYSNVILKARQMGFSTLIGLIQLDQALFSDDFGAGIIAQTEDDVKTLFRKKIVEPYLGLPPAMRDHVGLKARNTTEIEFGNGSFIRAGQSMRSATLQSLHVSEFGKICAKAPERAREIVTGAFETLAVGTMLFIESTAEGTDGYFYDYCMDALKAQEEKRRLTPLDFRLHFFAWWQKPSNRIEAVDDVVVDDNYKKYFDKLAGMGILLDAQQKAWYVKKSDTLGSDMKREHPSYPKEAFEVTLEGAIYEKELSWLRQQGRFTSVPWQAGLPVNTFWDFGVSTNNETTIWFHQRNGLADCFIRYYEAPGEGLLHFVNVMNDLGYTWGTHYLPHDADTRMQGEHAETREEILNRLGVKNTVIVPRTPDVNSGIEQTRQKMSAAWFDRENCARGIQCLDNYVRKWNMQRGCFTNEPLHNWASNGSDAFRQYGQGYTPVVQTQTTRKRTANWRLA